MFKKTRARLRAWLDGLLERVTYRLIKKYPHVYEQHRRERIRDLTAFFQKDFTLHKQFISKTEPVRQLSSSYAGKPAKGLDFVGKDFRPKHIIEAERVAVAQKRRADGQARIDTMASFFTDGIFNGGKPKLAVTKVVRAARPDPSLPPAEWLAEAERIKRDLRVTPMDNQAIAASLAEDKKPMSAAEMLGRVPSRNPESRGHVTDRVVRPRRFVPHSADAQANEKYEKRQDTALLTDGNFTMLPEEVKLSDFLPSEEADPFDRVCMEEPEVTRDAIQVQIDAAITEFAARLKAKEEGRDQTKKGA